MLLPWLGRVCLRRTSLYFPKIGYLFVFYLAWALLVSLVNAMSLYLSMFELCRQFLWFLYFVYLINNVSTPLQFRSVVLAALLGFIISAGTVVAFFERVSEPTPWLLLVCMMTRRPPAQPDPMEPRKARRRELEY